MNIEHLLNKFYEGNSTSEEERLLTEYFLNEENVEERWKEDRQLFLALHDMQIEVPANVSNRLEKTIMQFDVSQKIQPRKQTLYYWISGAAAILLLCVGLHFFTAQPSPQFMLTDTFSTPEEATLVVEQTLVFISTKLNKGLDIAADAGQEFEKLNQLLNKHFN
ncbi:MAG: hypothetical protein LBH22_04455 [Bacteroidales bacterium]|jgi:hypothetical protein|nr:hypothetical protein [Bacteroidales bacterium]